MDSDPVIFHENSTSSSFGPWPILCTTMKRPEDACRSTTIPMCPTPPPRSQVTSSPGTYSAALAVIGRFSPPPLEKHAQVRDAPVIDICVRVCQHPPRVIGIRAEMRLHVLVHVLLQVDPHRPVRANHFDPCKRPCPQVRRRPDMQSSRTPDRIERRVSSARSPHPKVAPKTHVDLQFRSRPSTVSPR